jgi:hypothetical protein
VNPPKPLGPNNQCPAVQLGKGHRRVRRQTMKRLVCPMGQGTPGLPRGIPFRRLRVPPIGQAGRRQVTHETAIASADSRRGSTTDRAHQA